MKLNVTYDANTLATAPSAFYAAVDYVVNLFNLTFTNNATVNIEVGYGDFPYDGSPVTPNLGESMQNNISFANYSQVTGILVGEGAPGATTLPSSSPFSGQLALGSAQEKALGLIGSSSTLDGWVGIASNAELQGVDGTSWSFSSTATPSANQYYVVGVIEHEFAEVMGRTSYLTERGKYGIIDLYRYASAGVRQTGTGDPAYFSIDRGNTNLDSFNNARIAAGDLGDWAPRAGSSGVFHDAGADAFLNSTPTGQINGLSSTDLTLMAALGWDATPASRQPITVAPGPQTVFGSAGDTIVGGSGPDVINGIAGPELISAGSGATTIWGGTGDTITGSTGSGSALIVGAAGATITAGSGTDLIGGSTGSQSITGGAGAVTIWGGAGDTITGGSGSAVIVSAGLESIAGGSGSTTVWGGKGDTITGSTGSGSAIIVGAAGTTITAGSGTDLIGGSTGSQSITGGAGNATIWGGVGDTITGGSGTAVIVSAGSESIVGGAGHTTVWGGVGDTITGSTGSGSAVIVGAANSTITGGSGSTAVWGGAGDTITGGRGTLAVTIDHANFPGAEFVGDNGTTGSDTVTGFSQLAGDRIFFANETPAVVNSVIASAQASNGNTLITFPDGATMTLIGITRIDGSFFG